jgi:imidazolonepropionase-like amidohydrolase
MKRLFIVTALLLAATSFAQPLVLAGGRLIDGFGGPPMENAVIVIEGNTIRAVGPESAVKIPTGARVIDTNGYTVMPGLMDMHVHLMIVGHGDYDHWDATYPSKFRDVIMPISAKQLLMAGVTTVRDLGAPLEDIVAVKNRINNGEIPGPRLFVSGPFLQKSTTPLEAKFRWVVNGPDDARRKVRTIVDGGADLIKLIDQDQMTLDELRAVVDEAHKRGLPVVAHAHRPEEIRRGLAVGVDCFEHTGLASAPEYPQDVVDAIRERTAKMNLGPLFWTPTIEGLLNYEYLRDNPEQLDDPAWQAGLPADIVADIKKSIQHPDRLPYFQLTPARRPTLARKFKQLQESGVVLLVGTDSGIPMKFHSSSTWRELDAWVNILGVDSMTAIRGATYWPSVAMKVDRDVGTVTPGKYADIIAVRGDALRYIALLQRVDVVVKRGMVYKQPS